MSKVIPLFKIFPEKHLYTDQPTEKSLPFTQSPDTMGKKTF